MTALLLLSPDDPKVVAEFLNEMNGAYSMMSSPVQTEQAEAVLRQLLGRKDVPSNEVLKRVLRGLQSQRDLYHTQYLAPRVLIASQQHVDEALARLRQGIGRPDGVSFGPVADFLGRLPPSDKSQPSCLSF